MAQIGIIGSEGAMGQALARVIEDAGHTLSGGIDRGGDAAALADASDVLVDFSAPQALDANLHAAIGAGVPLVIGTTGLEDRHHAAIDEAARAVAVLQTGNTSLGVNLLAALVEQAAAGLGEDWDIEILETNHRRKVDAPSGTAIAIANAAVEGKGGPFTAPKAEKELIPNTRGGDSNGVTVHSARMPGRMAHHELVFGTLGQTLTIRHDSINRESFMPGVTMAIREVVNRTGLTVGLDKLMGL